MEKDMRNTDAIACKHRSVSTRATNNRLEVAKKKRQKKEKIKERRKVEAIAAKRYRARGGMSSSREKEDESDIRNDTDPD